MNVTEANYYSQSWPFVNVFKHGEWISGRPEHPDPSRRWSDGGRLDLDPRGFVRRLAPGQVARVFIFGDGTHYHPGRYTVLYRGRGRIEYRGGATNVQRGRGRDTFDLAAGSALWLEIPETDPADPVREVRVLPPGGRCEDDVARYCVNDDGCGGESRCVPFVENYQREPFHPEFLADLKPFRVLRFMDWMQTNWPTSEGSSDPSAGHPASFEDWPRIDHELYRPVPFEVMADLCNVLAADLWITIPHNFDDASVRSVAKAIRDRLDPGLKVWVEHSNEVWNGQFGQYWATGARECAASSENPSAECDADGNGVLCNPGPWDRERQRCNEFARRGHARRTGEIAQIFDNVFGSASRDRLVRVLAWRISSIDHEGLEMLELKWDGREPLRQRVDVVAVAPYFGNSDGPVPSPDDFFARNEGSVNGAPEGTFTVLSGKPEDDGGTYSRLRSDVEALKGRAGYEHLSLVAYEGGQHLFTWVAGQGEALKALNSDPRMRELYTQYLELFDDVTGGSLLVHYSSPGGWWHHGAFGSKEYQGQRRSEAPKHDALEAFIESHRTR